MKKRLLERLAAVKELKAVAALYKKRKGCVLSGLDGTVKALYLCALILSHEPAPGTGGQPEPGNPGGESGSSAFGCRRRAGRCVCYGRSVAAETAPAVRGI